MYKTPSRRKKKNMLVRPNLTSLLDAIFIFIFFLLFSSDLKSLFEIPVDIPILSEKDPPPSKKVPLGLTLKITNGSLDLYSGTPLKLINRGAQLFQKFCFEKTNTYIRAEQGPKRCLE